MPKPLVSILIPAYNIEKWIPYTIQSALAQTWPRKEIIIVDDGSTDRTADVARRFASKELLVVSTPNEGQAGAVNTAFRLCQGDYIQQLDADDLLEPHKIELQLAALRDADSRRILLSSPWAHFYYRTRMATFVPTALWEDLSPVEWLLRSMEQNLHQANATWLVSRELAEAAGPWDASLTYDQDGEYFGRVILASESTRFVRDARMYYRMTPSNRVSHIGSSDTKKESLLRSIKLRVQRLRSFDDGERARTACLVYMQAWFPAFYPSRPDLVAELQVMAADLQGELKVPQLSRKYAWMERMFGCSAAAWAQRHLPRWKEAVVSRWDMAMHRLES